MKGCVKEMSQISDIEQLVEFVLGRDTIGSLITIVAWIVLLVNIYKYGKKGMMWIYNRQRGIEDSEEEQEDLKKSVKTLEKELDEFKEIHETDMNKLIERQDQIMQDMKDSITSLAKEMEEERNDSRLVDQSVLRTEIIRMYKDMLNTPNYALSMTDKENFDSLFNSYFLRKGNGRIHELYNEYLEKVKVDEMSIL